MLRILLELRDAEDTEHQHKSGGTECCPWKNPAFYEKVLGSRRKVVAPVTGFVMTDLRRNWGRNADLIPKQGYLQLGWKNDSEWKVDISEESVRCRREVQRHFLVGSKQFTVPYLDDAPTDDAEHHAMPLLPEAPYQHQYNASRGYLACVPTSAPNAARPC